MDSNYESIDTNVILRLILDDNYKDTKRVVKYLLNSLNEFVVDDFSLGEIEYVLSKNDFSRKDIIKELSRVLNNPMFIWNKETFRKVFSLYESHPSLSFNDCYLAIKADERNSIPLWTLDKKFANQARQAKLIA